MTELLQAQFALQPWWLQSLTGLLIGTGLGQLFFRSLKHSVEGFLTGDIATALVGQLVRFSVLVPVMVSLALFGKFALLAGALGLTLARLHVVSSVRRSV